jgi:pimeloyl-ACP methyl ester carboxylesterase
MLLALLALVLHPALPPAGIPGGSAEQVVKIHDKEITVFTYKPEKYTDGPLVLVFHGTLRNAAEYRDWSKVIADRTGGIVAAPLFDEKRFPVAAYQMGGMIKDKAPVPKDDWTWSMVPKIADALRDKENRKDMPYYLIGHSAGGQFLDRLAGFVSTDAKRVVAANPGSLLWPGEDMPFPFGFGELPKELGGEAGLKRYLAQPLTLYLGTGDVVQDKYFPKGKFPDLQGDSRFARGSATFKKAEALAKEKGWAFNWKKVEAPNVPHSSEEMFKHDRCLDALGWVGKK